jgi:hypothetical protein
MERFGHRLCDQEPVKGITVVDWEHGRYKSESEVDGQLLEIFALNERAE